MSKPFGEGLKYFRVDTDITDNFKIELMEEDHGDSGFAFVVKVWSFIYKKSYYIDLNDDEIDYICKKVIKKSRDEFDKLLKSAIKYKLFNKHLYNTYNILTSDGIQEKYFDISKRWRRVKLVWDFYIKTVDIDPYHLFICDKDGRIISEKHPKEIPGSKVIPRSTEFEKPKNGTHKESVQKPATFISAPPVINGNGKIPTEAIHDFCSLDYESQNDKFKKQVAKEWFDSFVNFNRIIDEDYPQIRISEYQLNIDKYIKLLSEPIDGKEVTSEELTLAVRKLAASGPKEGYSMFLKLQDYIKYVREPKTKKNNVTTKTIQPSKQGFGKI